jgi:DNA repair photolyase
MLTTVQTKSPLVIRDLELLKRIKSIEVGFSIGTANEAVRRMFEPNSPSIDKRVEVLEKLHSENIRTFAMIAPVLPKPKA